MRDLRSRPKRDRHGDGQTLIEPNRDGEPLGAYDAVIVPGTVETDAYRTDQNFLDWLWTAVDCEYKVSVCTGAILLGAAGLIDGHRATTHPMAFDDLVDRPVSPYPVTQRFKQIYSRVSK